PPEKWVYVEEGLQGDVSMLFELNFTHIKFILEATETTVQERPNAIDLIMNISQQRSLLLGELFNELDQYQKEQNYNLYYFTGKHAKYNLEHDKLEKLASSLELSVAQPWAANESWENIIEEVFIFTSSMRKYANNLE
ncbi:11526_t:CDS:2, partial [Rhizophagus irregularis]